MTGSAKQSISPRKERMDCFVANAHRNDEGGTFIPPDQAIALFSMDCRVT
jgi:hypothetical protein